MSISIRNLVIAGVAVFIVGAVALFPARAAYHWFFPDEIRLSGIGGTVWNGRASEGQIDALYLRNLNWTVSPWALLRGALKLEVSVSPAGGFLESDVEAGLSGAVTLTNLSAGINLEALRGLLPLYGIDGGVRLQLERLQIDGGIPYGAEGTVEVTSLVTPLSRSPIGSYRARLSGADDGISASLEDIDGIFDIAGSLRLDAVGNYEIRGLVMPTPEASPDIVRQLQFLGSPNERGQREFRLEGSL